MSPPLGVGVIGLGVMGRTHLAAYRAAARDGLPCTPLAVCDRDPERFRAPPGAGNLAAMDGADDLAGLDRHTDADRILADPRIAIVSICTHTDTHADLAVRALAAGKHVLVEKPVALRAADVRRVARAAAGAPGRCMPGMCMRFWPGWDWLFERSRDGAFGAVRSAAFTRLGAGPAWSTDFYRDAARSGGALVDLHIHDADAVYWLFGRPSAVQSGGSVDHVTTIYRFDAGPRHVAAEGGWSFVPSAPFRMRYTVCFEHATADWDLGRSPTLMVHGPGGAETPILPSASAYESEVRHFVEAASTGGPLRATMDDAVAVAEILDAERESLRTGAPVSL